MGPRRGGSRRVVLHLATAFMSISSVLALPAWSSTDEPPRPDVLERLGGQPCPNDSAFTCVTLTVPLDHFNVDDRRTIDVVFAVRPATGPRRGMFVIATGGPGSSGIAVADAYTSAFGARISERFDIVFFDQRGVGRSGGVTCPEAAAAWYRSGHRAVTPEQEASVKQHAKTFARDCGHEAGPAARGLLPYLGTDQAVEDLEAFRRAVGDDRLWLYGESYGTEYAQTYATRYGEHLAALVLDGTVDVTMEATDFYAGQAAGFGETLAASLQACNDAPGCAREVGGDAVAAYDRLVERLATGELTVRFPRPSGGFATRRFSLADLELVAITQMYAEADRMLFTRALAAWATHDDPVPLARLVYAALNLDPDTLDVVPDRSFSDAMYYAVNCRDYFFPGDGAEEKAENYLEAGDAVEASVRRLASAFANELPCVYWPAAGGERDRPPPLRAEGIPTLVLGATADPATPYDQGVAVYRRLDDGYLITKTGGPHLIFGWGDPCVDSPVTDFLVNDHAPAQRETTCDGVVADDYVPLAPPAAGGFDDPLDALTSVDAEINHLPEYRYWDGLEPVRVGCPHGGTLTITPDSGTDTFSFNRCTFTRRFTVTGAGDYHPDDDILTMDVTTSGRWDCDLHYRRTGDEGSVSGPCRR